jgi:periplasmic protein TonB
MSARADTLDRPEPLGKWMAWSVALHLAVAGLFFLLNWTGLRHAAPFGDVRGGGLGAVAVNVVATIPIPRRSGPENPLANNTPSLVPTPPLKAKPKPEVQEPEPNAIPIKRRNAKPSGAASERNTFREKQQEPENQIYSTPGQALVSPMVNRVGGGGLSLGNNSPFGQQCPQYANLLRNQVARNWRTSDLDLRSRTAGMAAVTFDLRPDGSVPAGSVRLAQRSGNDALDFSAQRAIFDSIPFPPIPAQCPQRAVDVEFDFELER